MRKKILQKNLCCYFVGLGLESPTQKHNLTHCVKISVFIAISRKSCTFIAILFRTLSHGTTCTSSTYLSSSCLYTISYCSSLKFNEHKYPDELLRHIIYIRISLIWAFYEYIHSQNVQRLKFKATHFMAKIIWFDLMRHQNKHPLSLFMPF